MLSRSAVCRVDRVWLWTFDAEPFGRDWSAQRWACFIPDPRGNADHLPFVPLMNLGGLLRVC
jgi:hypothetical protein